ncbi:uncharacterized protein LOC122383247 [Amphibalanus amphitrite]|uniref:uncharacterized protein LOC122383247 n=1 Tax=Amphibalanus amphitrite TaxID=1232801 RepID=UPI001C926FC3|nr:uncharacterized protein LOC122383247 [Amphibalanus amphitrite]
MEHVQEFWPQRRPMRSRSKATIAQRKGIFTFLSEGTFTKLPDNNIINLYQTFIEGVLVAEKKQQPNQPGIEFSRLFKTVWESFGKFQVFHTAGEVNRLVRWALRDLKRQGRIQRTHKGRYFACLLPEQPQPGCCPPVLGLPPGQRFLASRWGSQRRHLVSTLHRWDQYNQRRSQRLARTPDLPGQRLTRTADLSVPPSPSAGPVRGPGPARGPGAVAGPVRGPGPGPGSIRGPGPSTGPIRGPGPVPGPGHPVPGVAEAVVGGVPRVRPRLEPPPPPRPMSAPSLSTLYGRVPRLFPGG